MSVRTYDPASVSVLVGGAPITGFADGTFVSIERNNDTFQIVSGADGIVSRAKSNDKTGSMSITLAQTSPSNDVLEGIASLDELSSTGVVPVMVKDNSGRSVHFSGNAWVRRVPTAEFGKEISNREWQFDLADYVPFNGGNAEFEPTT